METKPLIPPSLSLRCQSRWPTALPDRAVHEIMSAPLPCRPVHSADVPSLSVIVPTCGQQPLTRLCLDSVLNASGAQLVELLVVDNGSTDGTASYLRELARLNPQVGLILNPENRGYAAANNQAVEQATGDIVVLLNNDTIVAPGWLEKLSLRLSDPAVGMVGCLTNRSGGENEIETSYQTYGEFLEFAAKVAQGGEGPDFDCDMLPLCCAALRKETFREVGLLDEGFGLGLFEDDDLSLRLRRAGYRIMVATDCFVHHFGQGSMGDAVGYAALMETNRRRFEWKWGCQWTPRPKRRNRQYQELIEEVRTLVLDCLPATAKVAVISRGDDELLRLGKVEAEHFMQGENGVYWGAHPADGEEAVARWKKLGRGGTEYLLVPEPSLWWFDFYKPFERFVRDHFELLVDKPGTCRLYRQNVPLGGEGSESA